MGKNLRVRFGLRHLSKEVQGGRWQARLHGRTLPKTRDRYGEADIKKCKPCPVWKSLEPGLISSDNVSHQTKQLFVQAGLQIKVTPMRRCGYCHWDPMPAMDWNLMKRGIWGCLPTKIWSTIRVPLKKPSYPPLPHKINMRGLTESPNTLYLFELNLATQGRNQETVPQCWAQSKLIIDKHLHSRLGTKRSREIRNNDPIFWGRQFWAFLTLFCTFTAMSHGSPPVEVSNQSFHTRHQHCWGKENIQPAPRHSSWCFTEKPAGWWP